ncbi:MAG: hypothetical protein WCW47_00850 [Candidatus Paceibacterota bacterium]|jgi:hypothetical protein
MFNIKNYLEKFSRRLYSSEEQKKKILEIIEKHTQIILSLEEMEIKNYIIHLKTSPAVLNKIFIYKSKILEDVTLQVKDLKIIDIK